MYRTRAPFTSPHPSTWYDSRVLRLALPLALFVLLNSTFAQDARAWTLQTAAFANAEQAAAAVSGLRERGFDAYSERSGAVTRVRVGCFLDRTSAEVVAEHAARDGEAQVVPLSPGTANTSGVTFCVRREAGFVPPAAWGIAERTAAHVTFWVDVAGRRYLRFDGQGWSIYQNVARLPGVAGDAAPKRTLRPAPVRARSLLVGSGEVLWRSPRGATFLIQDEEAVFSLTLVSPSEVD